ncbi:MAG: response regulator transcription factor [Chitinophagaceae bacterium]|jgi:two-component system copper resistance phosphate regulon response regulator CusR
MEKKYSILLVEDEVKLSNVIKSELQRLGYVVDAAFNGQEAESLFFSKTYNLVLLDISLPDKSGFELCKSFREHSKNAPIIMLTALSEIQDKIDAFKLGADDYMVKPFHFDELFARINVFLKRAEQENKEFANDVIEILDLVINIKTKTVFRNNIEIPLTAKEFALITLLAKNRGVVVSKQEILEKVWDLSFDTGTNTIEVYISFLRNKIDKPFTEKLIYTKSGFGYFIK